MIGKEKVGAAPVVIAGAIVDGKANYITLGGFGSMSRARHRVTSRWPKFTTQTRGSKTTATSA